MMREYQIDKKVQMNARSMQNSKISLNMSIKLKRARYQRSKLSHFFMYFAIIILNCFISDKSAKIAPKRFFTFL